MNRLKADDLDSVHWERAEVNRGMGDGSHNGCEENAGEAHGDRIVVILR